MRVALVTSVEPIEHDVDLDFLAPALQGAGVEVETPGWSDPGTDWSSFDLIKLSSPWDYHEHPREFLRWLRAVARKANLQNPLAIVEWNLSKRYLRELDAAGARTIPTIYSEPGEAEETIEEVRRRGWDPVVIKPVIDLGAMNLVRVDVGRAQQLLERFDTEVLVQPYLPSVATEGELALIYIAGELTHAVRKRPAPGDFRVQPLYGGTHERVEPTRAEREAAERALALAPGEPLYARVDLVRGDAGPLVMELELIEPALYLDAHPPAAVTLARALMARAG